MKIDLRSPAVQMALGVVGGAFIGFVFGACEPRPSKGK